MATPIPTRIKMQIRDLVTPATSPLQTKVSALATTLGYKITFDPEWGMLWASLSSYYPDQSTFIPSVVGVLGQWCDAFTTWLEEESNEVAVERFLDALKGWGVVRLVLEISPSSPRPTTIWRRSKSHFVLALPKARPSPQQTVLAGFASDFQALFAVSPSQVPAMSPSLTASSSADPSMSASAGGIDDWADLSLDSPVSRPVGSTSRTVVGKPSPLANVSNAHVPGDDPLPDIAAIERPEELCSRPPYRLVVKQEGSRRVEVQGSHQGSLKVLEGYLKHWVRHSTDYTNRPPLAEIAIKDSVFGLGLLYDTVTIESGVRGKEVNALLVLKIVENVLGYEIVGDGGPGMGSVWEFRRLRGFK